MLKVRAVIAERNSENKMKQSELLSSDDLMLVFLTN
jgi:hypothetical protein